MKQKAKTLKETAQKLPEKAQKLPEKDLQIEPEEPLSQQEEEPSPDTMEPPRVDKDATAELKAKIESIMYCIPDGIKADALANRLNLGLKGDIIKLLKELQAEYNARPNSLKLVQDGDFWKFAIPEEHTSLVLDAALPEFDKAVLETLAYIGWRGGSRQCDVVRVRSNKAYRHIQLLIEKGFIESSRSGLSKWLQPTKKFYEYFNIQQGQKLPVSKEVEEKLIEAEKAAEEFERQQKELEAQEKAAKAAAEEALEKKAQEEDGNDKDNDENEKPDEPDSGGEPESGEPEDEDEQEDECSNPDRE